MFNEIVTCSVYKVTKMPHTYDGNPVYKLHTDMGVYTTHPDSGDVYNHDFLTLEGKPVCLKLATNRSFSEMEILGE